MKKLQMAIIGCGDYVQRWESAPISESRLFEVRSLFDLNKDQAVKLQNKIGGSVADTEEAILNDADIDIVCVFVPPMVRQAVIERVFNAGKHVITTKPLAPSVAEAKAITSAAKGDLRCGVFYGRSGDATAETLKSLFESGDIGKLALYKQDWLHHYPSWNDWATDSSKNGGPFMDAMIHNMNLARFLFGRPVSGVNFFSDNHAHPEMGCNDTEFMKLDFEENGSAHLFITWAADLEVFEETGNAREHIDIFYMVTDQGWRITLESENDKEIIVASKEGTLKKYQVAPITQTPYDAFAESVIKGTPLRRDIISLEDAAKDIRLLTEGL